MPLHHSLDFPYMILEGGSFDPHDPPGSAPVRPRGLKIAEFHTLSYILNSIDHILNSRFIYRFNSIG